MGDIVKELSLQVGGIGLFDTENLTRFLSSFALDALRHIVGDTGILPILEPKVGCLGHTYLSLWLGL